jgi:hypothetical protein
MILIKGTDKSVRFKVYDNILQKNPIDLTVYNEFICAVTEGYGTVLIEKKFSTNDIKVFSDNPDKYSNYIIEVKFKKEDTANMTLNPSYEERIRNLELFGIMKNEEVTRFLITEFYLEGSGYYVHRNRR